MKRISTFVFLLCITLKSFGQVNNAYPLKSSIWENKEISVCWENPTNENLNYRNQVRTAIEGSWEKQSQIKFTYWRECKAESKGIRIVIEDEVNGSPHTKGLGNKLNGVVNGMSLNFDFINWGKSCRSRKGFCIETISMHEFGHALGFAHEQNRKDCKFANCLNQEQGTDGDWYLTKCDLNSIMNYCNPNWNNDGYLSTLDIEGVQALYGKPESLSLTPDQNFTISYTVQTLKKKKLPWLFKKSITHSLKVYISEVDKELSEIEKVTYLLHPTFKNREIVVNNSDSNFGLGLRVWGEFEITASILLKNGEELVLSKELLFDKN